MWNKKKCVNSYVLIRLFCQYYSSHYKISRLRTILFEGGVICDSVLFSYKMLIGMLVISLDEKCTIPEN